MVAWIDFDRHNFQLLMCPLHEKAVCGEIHTGALLKFTQPEPGLPGGPSIN